MRTITFTPASVEADPQGNVFPQIIVNTDGTVSVDSGAGPSTGLTPAQTQELDDAVKNAIQYVKNNT